MDTKGNIRHFEHLMDAKAAGFETSLSQKQAELLDELPLNERHLALVKLRHQERLAQQAEALKNTMMDGLQGRAARRVAKRSLVTKPAHKYR